MGTHDGTARTSERRVHTRAVMERGAHGEGEGLLHHGSSGTRWGCAQDAGQPALPTHRQREEGLRLRTRRRLPGTGQRPTRHGQAEDHAKASWRIRAGAIGGGSAASFRQIPGATTMAADKEDISRERRSSREIRRSRDWKPLDAKHRLVYRALIRDKPLTQRIDHEIEFFKHGDTQKHMRAHNHRIFVHPASHNFYRKDL
jgi:hypothetical protein